jgi:hypothetical protein
MSRLLRGRFQNGRNFSEARQIRKTAFGSAHRPAMTGDRQEGEWLLLAALMALANLRLGV